MVWQGLWKHPGTAGWERVRLSFHSHFPDPHLTFKMRFNGNTAALREQNAVRSTTCFNEAKHPAKSFGLLVPSMFQAQRLGFRKSLLKLLVYGLCNVSMIKIELFLSI